MNIFRRKKTEVSILLMHFQLLLFVQYKESLLFQHFNFFSIIFQVLCINSRQSKLPL